MIPLFNSPKTPDRDAALAQYRRRADIYDLELAALEPLRRAAVARLGLTRGDTVLDVGCGTGLSLDLLRREVGPGGSVIGIEQSDSMIAHARDRVSRHGWTNVTLLCAPVELAAIDGAKPTADAALFHFTHDILRSAAALENVGRHLRAGSHIVASGLQWANWWCWPVNLFVWPAALHSVSSLEGLDCPWSKLAMLTRGLHVDSVLAGGGYIARGERAADAG